MFVLRNYRKGDFDALYAIDQVCFDTGIAYSRGELQSFIERKQSFCIVAEAKVAASAKPGATGTASVSAGVRTSHAGPREAGGGSGQRIAGFVLVEIHHQGYGHIITIDVLSEYRRQHLGTLLLEAAEEHVRKIDGFMMVLETAVNNQAALAFYDRHKYKVLKKLPGYYGKRLDAWFLTKRL